MSLKIWTKVQGIKKFKICIANTTNCYFSYLRRTKVGRHVINLR